MLADDQMLAREGRDGDINLAIGEAYLISDEMKQVFAKDLEYTGSLQYPTYGGNQDLIEELRQTLNYKHIIITNGGKQGLAAIFYAFKQSNKNNVIQKGFHWPSIPGLAKVAGLQFNHDPTPGSVRLVCSPNNPDGNQSMEPCDIWDAAYAHQVYGFVEPPPHRVAVFSASKVLGLSGFRVGWICTDDDVLADHCRFHVELATSGVSSPAQQLTARILRVMRANPDFTSDVYHRARSTLIYNGLNFHDNLGKHCEAVLGVPASMSGMFAFFKARDPEAFAQALKQSRVRLVDGAACGAAEAGWYRMSLGHTKETVERAVGAIATYL